MPYRRKTNHRKGELTDVQRKVLAIAGEDPSRPLMALSAEVARRRGVRRASADACVHRLVALGYLAGRGDNPTLGLLRDLRAFLGKIQVGSYDRPLVNEFRARIATIIGEPAT